MNLSNLEPTGADPRVVLVQTTSVGVTNFMKDILKSKYNCGVDSYFVLESKADLDNIRDIGCILPHFAKKWIVEIRLDKYIPTGLQKLLLGSSSCVFFCVCERYKTFKTFQEINRKLGSSIYPFYLQRLNLADMVYIYNKMVPEEHMMPKKLFSYVRRSYASDVDKVMLLFNALVSGKSVTNRKELVDLCGIGGLSTEGLVLSLLKRPTGNPKGLKMMIHARNKEGCDLGMALGYKTMYYYMRNALKTLLDLKVLMVSNVIYDEVIQKDIPEGYFYIALKRYQKFIPKLSNIPISRLLLVNTCMKERVWENELDYFNFVYHLYSVYMKQVTEEL